jgi:hypothetical protein
MNPIAIIYGGPLLVSYYYCSKTMGARFTKKEEVKVIFESLYITTVLLARHSITALIIGFFIIEYTFDLLM